MTSTPTESGPNYLESKSRALVKSYDFANDGYQVYEEINSGSFARVHKGHNKRKEQVAIKVMDLSKTTRNFRTKLLPMELIALRKLNHPYIVKVLDIYYFQQRVYIFMELADGGNLIEYVLKYGAVNENKARVWFAQICHAVIYMQNCLLAHRDLKCDNVLLHQEVAKLTDFSLVCQVQYVQQPEPTDGGRVGGGTSGGTGGGTVIGGGKRIQKLATTFCGSPAYVAPEILLSRPYDPFIADCWSLGIILYVMLNNALPFDDTDLPSMIANQLRNRWSFNNRVQPFPSLSSRQLIKAILQPKPALRYNITKITEHPWLKPAMIQVSQAIGQEVPVAAPQLQQQQQQQQTPPVSHIGTTGSAGSTTTKRPPVSSSPIPSSVGTTRKTSVGTAEANTSESRKGAAAKKASPAQKQRAPVVIKQEAIVSKSTSARGRATKGQSSPATKQQAATTSGKSTQSQSSGGSGRLSKQGASTPVAPQRSKANLNLLVNRPPITAINQPPPVSPTGSTYSPSSKTSDPAVQQPDQA